MVLILGRAARFTEGGFPEEVAEATAGVRLATGLGVSNT